MTSTFTSLWVIAIVVAIYFVLPIIALIVIIWLGVRYFDRRYKGNTDPSKLLSGKFVRTNEVFRDPKDDKLYRVYYNPESGEREYVLEVDSK